MGTRTLNDMTPAAKAGQSLTDPRPTQDEAEAAVRTLLRWAGDDPTREGLLDTPRRVAKSYKELFGGYAIDPVSLLERTFEEVEGYDEIILLRDIRLESYCEHHMVPIIGVCHVAYLPRSRVVGISKLARVVDAYSKRLQIQEKLTVQIASTINDVLQDGRCPYYRGPWRCYRAGGIVCDAHHGINTEHAIFGGDRSTTPHATHACPGYAMAMGVLLGAINAVLEPTPGATV